jgi:transcription elongation factor Elf1
MGRRRRRVVRIVKKKLPTVFVCPRCGEEAVRVTIAKDTGKATVMCALCQLKDEFQAHPAAQAIDVYSFFADRFYGVKDPRAIIPHDRETKFAPPEEPSEPEPVESQPMQTERSMEQPENEPASSLENSEAPNPPGEVQAETPTSETLSEQSASSEETARQEEKEEEEPFADILENKDKKRYSSNPIPEQKSEQTSQA